MHLGSSPNSHSNSSNDMPSKSYVNDHLTNLNHQLLAEIDSKIGGLADIIEDNKAQQKSYMLEKLSNLQTDFEVSCIPLKTSLLLFIVLMDLEQN